MLNHYYTLHHIARKVNELIGLRVTECFSQERNSLMLNIAAEEESNYIQFIGDAKNDTLFLRTNFARARKNTIDLLGDLIDETFQGAEVIEKNRIIKFEFVNSFLYFQIFGGKNSKVFLTDKENLVIDIFNADKDLVGKTYEIPENRIRLFSEFTPDDNLVDAIAKSEDILGSVYAEEAIARTGMIASLKLREVKKEKLPTLRSNAKRVVDDLMKSSKYYLIQEPTGTTFISLIPLIKYPEILQESEDLSELIKSIVVGKKKKESTKDIKSFIKSTIDREENKLKKNIEIASKDDDFKDRIEKYRIYGDLLMSHPTPQKRLGKEISLSGIDGTEHKIRLDPRKNLIVNAKIFFDKARKSEQELEIRQKRLPQMKEQLDLIYELKRSFEHADSLAEFEVIKKKLKQSFGAKMQTEPQKREEKFRRFDLGENFEAYVGKNAANNDELTMKFAKPNDLWLHARGSSGSHVVLRMNGKETKPPKAILEKAAGIAAYYSGSKNAKYTPVAYTYKKYVRKPKGANVGAVTISREEVIMVEPKLPNV